MTVADRSGAGAPPPREVIAVRPEELSESAAALLDKGHRLALVCGTEYPSPVASREAASLAAAYLFLGPGDARSELRISLDPARPQVPSLAPLSFPASRFEREMRDQLGVVPVGHPQPRPLVRHPAWPESYHPLRADAGPVPRLDPHPEPFPFLTVEGPGVYEIPVGPVHAGLIEPGHFRFSVVGESILKLKARLWYVHKGVEPLFHGRPPRAGGRAGRAGQRGYRGRPRPGLRPRRRGRPRPDRQRRGRADPRRAAGARTPLQPRDRPGRPVQRRRPRHPQRARQPDPRTAAAAQRRDHRPPAAARRRDDRRRPAPRAARTPGCWPSWPPAPPTWPGWPWTTAWCATGSPAPQC